MDISFSEHQLVLARTVRDFLAKECPKSRVRELEEDERGYCPEIWAKMAELGWIGLEIPEEYGGMGMSFQDLCVVLEEMGKSILPGPFFCTVIDGVIPILEAGSEEQKSAFLPEIAEGKIILTMALLESDGRYDARHIATAAVPKGSGLAVNGTKLFVEMAQAATHLVVVGRMRGAEAEDGVSLFIMDANSEGIEMEVIPTIGMDKLCQVSFHEVLVPRDALLGNLDHGWPIVSRVLQKAALAKCAESVGGLQAVLDMTVRYCRERVQYDRPIGAFQAIQHILADMWISMNTSKFLVYKAISMESQGLQCRKETAAAKSFVNEIYKRVTERALALHGAIGTSRDHDIGLYYRRAKAADIAFGSTDFHREQVAQEMGLAYW